MKCRHTGRFDMSVGMKMGSLDRKAQRPVPLIPQVQGILRAVFQRPSLGGLGKGQKGMLGTGTEVTSCSA